MIHRIQKNVVGNVSLRRNSHRFQAGMAKQVARSHSSYLGLSSTAEMRCSCCAGWPGPVQTKLIKYRFGNKNFDCRRVEDIKKWSPIYLDTHRCAINAGSQMFILQGKSVNMGIAVPKFYCMNKAFIANFTAGIPEISVLLHPWESHEAHVKPHRREVLLYFGTLSL